MTTTNNPTPLTDITDNPNAARLAVLFPGQGSQAVGMLADWADSFSQVQQTFAEASDALGFDLWAISQGTDSSRSLDATAFTQPALLTASMAIWRILQQEVALHPSYLAGHSLGEYTALCAAGVIDFKEAVQLVHQRGQFMTQAITQTMTGKDSNSAAHAGKMAAVLGLEDTQVQAICDTVMKNTADAIVSPANFNSPGQVVIAGNAVGVDAVMAQVSELGNKSMPLKVSVPSHCQLMTPAAQQLAEKLNAITFMPPKIPVIQNRHARVEADITAIKQALIEQLSLPVLWSQTEDFLAANHITLQIECGSGSVLTNLAKRQHQKIDTLATDKVVRLEKIREMLA